MASVDVPVALLGYGTVGAAVNRLLNEQADDIERATGHRLRVVKALVRDPTRRASSRPTTACSRRTSPRCSTTRRSRSSPRSWAASTRPASTCSSCCGAASTSSPRTSSSSRGAGPSSSRPRPAAGVQLRFEASVCAAIPVIKVLRESLVVTNVHRVLGIVNGTTNYMLTEMEAGKTLRRGARRRAGEGLRRGRPDRRRLRRRRRGEDGDPRHGRVQLALRARRRRDRSASTASTRSTSPPRASSRW